MFELQHIGHAGWVIKNGNFKGLCDPWFNPSGAFFSAWFPFPDNLDLLTSELVDDLDFIYISHSHQDHFDPWFLESVDKSISIIIPKFLDKLLFRKVKQLGFKSIIQLDENDEIYIKGVRVKLIIEDKMIEKDSGILFDDGKYTVLNLNDCHPEYNKVKKFAPKVDVLLLQSSSAIWWPCVYEYEERNMKSLGRLKRRNVISRSLKYAQKLSPRAVVPNAGPPAFLYDEASYWDDTRREDFNPFILQDDIHKYFLQNNVPSLFVIPGSKIFVDDSIYLHTDSDKRDHIYTNLKSYFEDYRERRRDSFMNLKATDEELSGLVDKFSKCIRDIVSKSLVFKHKVDFPILVDFDSLGKWVVDFSKSVEECILEHDDQFYNYHFKFNPDIVAILLREKDIDFEDYLLSMRFKCNRKVDEFNEFLFAILKNFDVRRLRISEINYMNATQNVDESETFVLKDNDGVPREVKRYCPHNHVDLKECGYLNEDNELVCPLHGWKFNLENGKCTNQSGDYNILK